MHHRAADASRIRKAAHYGRKWVADRLPAAAKDLLQTLAVIAEHLELDWHRTRTDERLREIDVGGWGGLYYQDIVAEAGAIVDPEAGLFTLRPPGGEYYDDVALRLRSWLDDNADEAGDRLIVMHGMSSRVLRALLTGAPVREGYAAPVADGIRQGALVEIADGRETILDQAEPLDPF